MPLFQATYAGLLYNHVSIIYELYILCFEKMQLMGSAYICHSQAHLGTLERKYIEIKYRYRINNCIVFRYVDKY